MVQALTGPKLDRDLIEFFKLDTLGCQVLDPNGYGPGRTADYYFPAYGVIAEKKELRALIPPASRREKKDPVGNMVGREVFWDSLRVSLTMDRAYYSSSMNCQTASNIDPHRLSKVTPLPVAFQQCARR